MPALPDEGARTARWIYGIVGAGVLAVTFVLAHSHVQGPPCLFRTVLGLPCPGCGMTRSLEAVWHGRFLASFRFHPLGLPAFVACAALLVLAALPAASRPDGWLPRIARLLGRTRVQYVILALVLGVWLVRLGFAVVGSGWFLW